MDTLQTCRTSCLKHSQHRRSALEYDLTSRWVWREIEDILFRPPGRPSRKPLVRYKSFRYQAESWSLTSLQHRLMKTGGRLVKHARYYWLLLAEGYLNRRLFGDMLHRIWALPLPSG